MKIRRSARTILATLMLLAIFTSLTVWHNKAPNKLSQQEQGLLIKELSQKNQYLVTFVEYLEASQQTPGFYVTGKSALSAWPENALRACYSDPLARHSQTSAFKTLVRYRSIEDFLVILKHAEEEKPGTLGALDFQNDAAIPEPAVLLSLRLIVSLIVGFSGILLVRQINR